jgi:hypothetical protein
VDRLSKRTKYAVTHTTVKEVNAAKVFFDVVVRHHGLPAMIVSDRDPKFVSSLWTEVMRLMGVKLSLTTAQREQADG